MITFDLTNTFQFNYNGETLEGSFREFTKSEHRDFKAKNEAITQEAKHGQELANKIRRNERLMEVKEKTEDWKGLEKLMAENNKLEDELKALADSFSETHEKNEALRDRFELCLGGKDRDTIIELAETHGYEVVFKTIGEAIEEGKLKA